MRDWGSIAFVLGCCAVARRITLTARRSFPRLGGRSVRTFLSSWSTSILARVRRARSCSTVSTGCCSVRWSKTSCVVCGVGCVCGACGGEAMGVGVMPLMPLGACTCCSSGSSGSECDCGTSRCRAVLARTSQSGGGALGVNVPPLGVSVEASARCFEGMALVGMGVIFWWMMGGGGIGGGGCAGD